MPRSWPLTRLDVAGAFGDIGVLFPIAIALITLNHLNPTALFLTAGLTYCLAARYFQIPMAVQPFKAGRPLPSPSRFRPQRLPAPVC